MLVSYGPLVVYDEFRRGSFVGIYSQARSDKVLIMVTEGHIWLKQVVDRAGRYLLKQNGLNLLLPRKVSVHQLVGDYAHAPDIALVGVLVVL